MKDDKLYKDWAFCRIKFQQPTTFVIGNVGQEINL